MQMFTIAMRRLLLSFSCFFIFFLNVHSIYADSLGYCAKLNQHETSQVQQYISKAWRTLTRTHQHLLSIAEDPKLKHRSNEPWIIYVPSTISLDKVKASVKNQMVIDDYNRIEFKTLPNDITRIHPQGLLYLPYNYVVPGGRFNEMYGWDSYFIVLGLLRDGHITLAKHMVDNFKFEIDNYGKVLNANRTYYLTRSQPPLFTEMILAVYNRTQDKRWLQSMLPSIKKYYQYWTTGPRRVASVGLSRYYPDGNGPAFEVTHTANHTESQYYPQVKEYLKTHRDVEPVLNRFYDAKTDQLTSAFYKSDRAVRESGWDLSSKYGPFGVFITDNISVALNSLLYKMETDTAHIYRILKNKAAQRNWERLAKKRAILMNKYLWDDPTGYYLDYNFVTKRRTPHVSLTSYYPLWAGVASKAQARRLQANLMNFDAKGGVVTSAYVTGQQWDAPFGWAPLHYFIVMGLKHYGYQTEAQCIAKNFITVVNDNFNHYGTIFEKYNVWTLSANTATGTHYGYNDNVIGFGWTNGVYLELLKFLNSQKK
jgi:alpha,alpha-trehalase